MAFLERNANRGSVSTGYDIDNSLKVQANSGNEWFYRNNPTAGNRRTFTFSFWLKRTQLAGYEADQYLISQGSNQRFHFAGHTLRFMWDGGSTELEASAKLRDTSAWYHIVIAVDTTQSTAANRVKAYLNGASYPWNNTKYPSQNSESGWMNTADMYFNTFNGDGSYDNSGYWAEVVVIDGQQLDPTSFGEYNDDGVWVPIDVSGLTFGSEGFYLKFDDASDIGADSSGNSNDVTLNNITSADIATDTPTNNFCTFNPLMADNNAPTISEGATKATGGGGYWNRAFGTQGVKNGKWYYEFKVTNTSYSGYFGASTTPAENSETLDAQFMYNTSFVVGNPARIDYYYWQNGSQVSNESTGWGTISVNDIIGVALDLDASTKKFYIYKNGSLVNSGGTDLPTNMQDEFIFPMYVQYENRQDEVNFGGYTTSSISSAASDANGYGTFEYAPPSGYYALCTKNLAEYG